MTPLSSLVDALLGRCRLVDLSAEVHPGIMYADGRYRWGSERRRFELRQWISMGNHFQTFIDAGSHVGTHVDMPCHIHEGAKGPNGRDLASADMPLQTFFGQAIALDCGAIPPGADGRASVEPAHLSEVAAGDIVLLWSSKRGREQPSLSLEGARRLAELPIKMIGVQNVVVPYDQHVALLGKAGGPIPIIEELEHCEDLRVERFLFMGLPMRVHHLEASWIRAVAFEPRPA
jgi:kynurenine formamidase